MLLNLISLNYFDVTTLGLTLFTVVFVQWMNDISKNDTLNDGHTSEISEPPATTKPQLRRTETYETALSQFSLNTSPNSSARNSLNNGNTNIPIPSHGSSTETYSDEYHEDEDTLSLENLFPCDQSEIYASKKISFIIDELIQTEANYVNNLRKGLQNYTRLHERQDLPEALKGGANRTKEILGNINEILALHEKQILPLMLRNQRDLKMLFDEFSTYFDKNYFYCYVIFMIHKKTSMQLRQENREFLQNVQNEIKDKLGIDSFLVQPIQRLTRYPLLLQQFISEFYKSGISCKPVLVSVCKLETRMRKMLEVVNQAEEIPNIDELNEQLTLTDLGYFRKSTEFDAYHYRSRKKYRAKVFLFERCLLCTEVRKRRLSYRQHYTWDTLLLQLNTTKCIKVLIKVNKNSNNNNKSLKIEGADIPDGAIPAKEEYDFTATEALVVTHWMRCAYKIIETARVQAIQYGKFQLPMDIILGLLFGIWFIWQFL